MTSLLKKLFHKKTPSQATLETIDCSSLYYSKIALYTGEGVAALSHLKLWIPVLQKTGHEFCIITRTMAAFNACKKYYNSVNIIYAKTPQDLEKILNNLNLKVIFYLSNTGNNLHICRFTKYRHIFLGHGDSNKSGSAHNGFKLYDEVWVSGKAHIDRFAKAGVDMNGTELKIIGLPQFSLIHQTKASRDSLLYLPTWEGTYKEQSYSSLPIAKELLCNRELPILDIAIKLHPMTGTKNQQYGKLASDLFNTLQDFGTQTQIYPPNINVLDIMGEHGGYICDNSAVVTNALLFNRPLFIYTPQGPNYVESDMVYENFSYTFSKPGEFIVHLKSYYDEGDIMAERRENIIDYFVSRESIQNNIFQKYIDDILCN